MADKFLLISVILTLVVCGEMKAWVALLILSRDLLILGVVGGGVRPEEAYSHFPDFFSKVHTTCLMLFIGTTLLLNSQVCFLQPGNLGVYFLNFGVYSYFHNGRIRWRIRWSFVEVV